MDQKDMDIRFDSIEKDIKAIQENIDFMLDKLKVLARISFIAFEDPRDPEKPETIIR